MRKRLGHTLIKLKNRIKVLEYLSDKCCELCFNDDIRVLTFDHKNPKEKLFNIADSYNKSFSKILAEIRKCRIICHNCHHIHNQENGSFDRNIDAIKEQIKKIELEINKYPILKIS